MSWGAAISELTHYSGLRKHTGLYITAPARVMTLSSWPLLLVVLYATPAISAQVADSTFQQLAESVYRPIVDAHDIPGIAIGVTYKGETYTYTSGFAVRATQQPVTADTLFELGSVSKLFNVALAALAEQRGLLSLESPVSAVVPAIKGSAFDQMTLYDLAAHANGGLPLQVPGEVKTDADLAQWLARWTTPDNPKNTRGYSNISIGLLGRITGEAFGGNYETALSEELLPELGLEETFITVPESAMARYAYGYDRREDKPIRVNPGLLDSEAYGVKSTVSDMTRFLAAHLGSHSVSEDVCTALAKSREARYDTPHFAQAMVWEAYPWPVTHDQLAAGNSREMSLKPQPITRRDAPLTGPVFFSKTGSTNGFGAYVAVAPTKSIGVVVLANRYYPNTVRAEAGRELLLRILQESQGTPKPQSSLNRQEPALADPLETRLKR